MNRRQSAVIRITAWSIVAVVLLIVLALGIAGKIQPISFGFNSGYFYPDSGKYQAGGGQIDGDDVHSLDINWIDGTIHIETYEGDTVQFLEKSSKKLDEEDQLQYYNKNGRLLIQYQKARKKLISFEGSLNKELTVKIPEKTAEKMEYVSVDTVSSDTKVKGITSEKIDLNSTSGDFELGNSRTGRLSVNSTSGSLTGDSVTVGETLETDTVSGDVSISGSVQSLEFSSTSGSVSVVTEVCPEKVSTDTVSGDVSLRIPENDGFEYESDSVSGLVKCDFHVALEDDKGIYKDGGAEFRFDTVSGDIQIKTLDE